MSEPSTPPTIAPEADAEKRRPKIWAFLPLAGFVVLAGLFYHQLYAGDPSTLPSVLIGRPVPAFDLPPVEGLVRPDGAPLPGFAAADLTGAVTVVNVWASWCGPCREEHPLLVDLAEDTRFRLVGINYKDDPDNAARFLNALGNPFSAVGSDRSGRVGIDWGVYGVPETFVVATDGTIAYKHIGPISPESLRDKLLPAIEAALSKSTAPPAGG